MKLWSLDSEGDRRSPIRTLTDTAAPITCIAFSGDGKLLASGGRDRTIKLWYAETGQLAKTLTGHTGSVMSLAFDPDGLLVSGSTDGTVKVWHPESGKTVNTLVEEADAIISVALDATGQILVSGSASGTIKIWQLA
jgi:WD40 repeat protein